ncbi:thioredoxin family protein [Sandarakinorhabdus sp.]|uniref:thioredoxin family protein n=1 Tax=Sandarakinorhabdus sp. TaxID=1916663 RepID=UPI00286E2504|nr:thioredoxin family protein [Sandarakinorhabdus sp.]
MRSVTDTDFESAIARPGPVLVVFEAVWCRPCVRMRDEVAEAAGRLAWPVLTAELDAAQNAALASKVRAVPSAALYRDGVLLATKPGAWPASALLGWIQGALAAPGSAG